LRSAQSATAVAMGRRPMRGDALPTLSTSFSQFPL
jgi:hypothetical protein